MGNREFWIDSEDADLEDNYAGNAMFEHPRQGPPQWQATCIHVIEKSAYHKLESENAALKEKLDMAVESLKNWYDWEQEQIKKEGPYVGEAINKLINEAKETLQKIGEMNETKS